MKELIFVYQAKSGWWNGMLDSIHKVTSPSTYPCHLCSVTYGLVGMNKEWKKFIYSLLIPVHFYHLDDLPEDFPKAEFPCAFFRTEDGIKLIITKDELISCKDVNDLIALVSEKLAAVSEGD
ncbi:hypothetical protein DS745_04170 [Anaerobacillus alkaliphilus]|uniref:GTPase n=1 Tax=Anaerobacillus alkaliphilus TaxID=1548597 RepID=A0A4Q0VZQ7_9BACI|nr:hypothetical protein [Anaerobacillus alkaliphilus]RXJ04586.1 hypothetical protein DS745_04170 [Anaerobacillus alkaliphilus]